MDTLNEQRSNPRVGLQSRIFIELKSPEADYSEPGEIAQCKTLDVSKNGLKAQLSTPLRPQAILRLGVELPSVTEPLYLAAQVRWCRSDPETENSWVAGLMIMNTSDSDINSWREILQRL
jgi:PilZ domain